MSPLIDIDSPNSSSSVPSLGVSFFTTGLDLVGYDIGKLLALVLWVGAVLVWLVGRWLRFILSARSTSEEAPDWDTGTDDPP